MGTEPVRHVCPHCGHVDGAHECLTRPEATPVDDDISLCLHCGRWSIFKDGQMCKPSKSERESIGQDEYCTRVHVAWVLARMKAALRD